MNGKKIAMEPAKLYFAVPVEPAKLYFEAKNLGQKPGQKTGQKAGQKSGGGVVYEHEVRVINVPWYGFIMPKAD